MVDTQLAAINGLRDIIQALESADNRMQENLNSDDMSEIANKSNLDTSEFQNLLREIRSYKQRCKQEHARLLQEIV